MWHRLKNQSYSDNSKKHLVLYHKQDFSFGALVKLGCTADRYPQEQQVFDEVCNLIQSCIIDWKNYL